MSKEQQVAEMSGIITKSCENRRFVSSMKIAEALYEADYRKQSEGEWILVKNGHGVCSVCNRQDNIDNLAHFCRYCGARMKGGDSNA